MAFEQRRCGWPEEPRNFETNRLSITSYKVKGMNDISAARRVHDSLKRIPGVIRVLPNLETSELRIEYDPKSTETKYFETAIMMAGFDSAG